MAMVNFTKVAIWDDTYKGWSVQTFKIDELDELKGTFKICPKYGYDFDFERGEWFDPKDKFASFGDRYADTEEPKFNDEEYCEPFEDDFDEDGEYTLESLGIYEGDDGILYDDCGCPLPDQWD